MSKLPFNEESEKVVRAYDIVTTVTTATTTPSATGHTSNERNGRLEADWKRKSITVQTAGGLLTVKAKVRGNLAVHLSLSGDYHVATITHVPTGCAVTRVWKEDAMQIADSFQRLDWNFSNPAEMPTQTKDGVNEIIIEHRHNGGFPLNANRMEPSGSPRAPRPQKWLQSGLGRHAGTTHPQGNRARHDARIAASADSGPKNG